MAHARQLMIEIPGEPVIGDKQMRFATEAPPQRRVRSGTALSSQPGGMACALLSLGWSLVREQGTADWRGLVQAGAGQWERKRWIAGRF